MATNVVGKVAGLTPFLFAAIRDEKTQNTAGGTFELGALRTRDLNVLEDPNGIGVTLATNRFTLPPGTYMIFASAPAVAVILHQAVLYDITATAVALRGSSEFTATTNPHQTRSHIVGKIAPTVSTTYEIQHISSATQNTNGFGVACNFGVEVYTEVLIIKIA